jgi:hypothetical protein
VNLFETTAISTIGAVAGGVLGWIFKGRYHADSLQVKQAQAVLTMWQATAESQHIELTQMRNELVVLRQRIEHLEHTIRMLEAENANLKSLQ